MLMRKGIIFALKSGLMANSARLPREEILNSPRLKKTPKELPRLVITRLILYARNLKLIRAGVAGCCSGKKSVKRSLRETLVSSLSITVKVAERGQLMLQRLMQMS